MITNADRISDTTQKIETNFSLWNWLYTIGGVAALIALFTNILDVTHGFGGTAAVAYGSRSASEWFTVYQQSPWEGLYALGILNIVYMATMLPVYIALFGAHRRQQAVQLGVVLIVFLLSTSIYISTNAAIPMLVLSHKYALAGAEPQRAIFLAAGEAILARGEDFTVGSFIPLFLGGLAALATSLVMLRGGVFGKTTAWIGTIGFTFLSLFTICATFIPVLYSIAFYGFGSIGGLLALAWFVLIARRLFQLGRSEHV